MGTTVASIHLLGVREEEIRANLPKRQKNALVGTWSERYVSVFPENLLFDSLDRVANALSKKLDTTALALSMFDGDSIELAVFASGKRLTRHAVIVETDTALAGKPKAFCQALGLPEELAPKLKRLLTCSDQEEKLGVLAALLGLPLWCRWDNPPADIQPVAVDFAPLEEWLAEHPAPPKLKNRCKMELIQDLPDMALEGRGAYIFRPLSQANEEESAMFHVPVGTVVGNCCSGGFWGRERADGTLELVPLQEDDIFSALGGAWPGDLFYAELDGRLVTGGHCYEGQKEGNYSLHHSVILSDSAGILPTPLPIEVDGRPRIINDRNYKLTLLPDGGFSAVLEPVFHEENWNEPPKEVAPRLQAVFGPDGALRSTGPAPELRPYHSSGPLTLGGVEYHYEEGGYHKDGILRRLDNGAQAAVPYMPNFDLSPDGSLLFAAGYDTGLAVYDSVTLELRHELRRRDDFYTAFAQQPGFLWVGNGGYLECYTSELELVSRHRLAGDLADLRLDDRGDLIAMTYQHSKYHTRVYRLSQP